MQCCFCCSILIVNKFADHWMLECFCFPITCILLRLQLSLVLSTYLPNLILCIVLLCLLSFSAVLHCLCVRSTHSLYCYNVMLHPAFCVIFDLIWFDWWVRSSSVQCSYMYISQSYCKDLSFQFESSVATLLARVYEKTKQHTQCPCNQVSVVHIA